MASAAAMNENAGVTTASPDSISSARKLNSRASAHRVRRAARRGEPVLELFDRRPQNETPSFSDLRDCSERFARDHRFLRRDVDERDAHHHVR